MSIFDLTSTFTEGPRRLFGKTVTKFPIQRDPTHFQISESYHYSRTLYSKAALGVPHPDFPEAMLVSEEPTEIQADLIAFSRTYSTVPSVRSEPVVIAVQFPGMQTSALVDITTVREPLTLSVLGREKYEYFLTADPFGEIDPANKIPVLRAFIVLEGANAAQYLHDAGGAFDDATSPTLTVYQSWIAAGTEIIVKDSEVTQYAGNIWCRKTIYAAAR